MRKGSWIIASRRSGKITYNLTELVNDTIGPTTISQPLYQQFGSLL